MKQNILIIQFVLFLTPIFSQTTFSEVKFENYVNNNYNYEIIIPQSWTKEEPNLPDRHIFILKNGGAEVKVRAFKSPNEDIDKIVHSETWDLRKIDPDLMKIIETEKIKIKKNITGKLLLFEYKSKKTDILQRTLITKNNNVLYIVECKAPRKTFYKFEDIFTTVFASFKYISSAIENNNKEVKEEPKKEENKSEADKLNEESLKEESGDEEL